MVSHSKLIMRETCETAVTEFINGINYLSYDTVEYITDLRM